jgi:hypothetical protein
LTHSTSRWIDKHSKLLLGFDLHLSSFSRSVSFCCDNSNKQKEKHSEEKKSISSQNTTTSPIVVPSEGTKRQDEGREEKRKKDKQEQMQEKRHETSARHQLRTLECEKLKMVLFLTLLTLLRFFSQHSF